MFNVYYMYTYYSCIQTPKLYFNDQYNLLIYDYKLRLYYNLKFTFLFSRSVASSTFGIQFTTTIRFRMHWYDTNGR